MLTAGLRSGCLLATCYFLKVSSQDIEFRWWNTSGGRRMGNQRAEVNAYDVMNVPEGNNVNHRLQHSCRWLVGTGHRREHWCYHTRLSEPHVNQIEVSLETYFWVLYVRYLHSQHEVIITSLLSSEIDQNQDPDL